MSAVEHLALSGLEQLKTWRRNLRRGAAGCDDLQPPAERSLRGTSRQYTARFGVRCVWRTGICGLAACGLPNVAVPEGLPKAPDTPDAIDSREVRW